MTDWVCYNTDWADSKGTSMDEQPPLECILTGVLLLNKGLLSQPHFFYFLCWAQFPGVLFPNCVISGVREHFMAGVFP